MGATGSIPLPPMVKLTSLALLSCRLSVLTQAVTVRADVDREPAGAKTFSQPPSAMLSAVYFGQRPAAFNSALQGGADVAAAAGADEAEALPGASLQMASET